ncbi:MAG: hypothetical protein H8E66_01675 [Planctomycetes bacterium]|nr:hypothetical protein [Planctomycetota bacterium]
MRSPLPQLTTILLLLHMVFGCCFHHVHACHLDRCQAETSHACDGDDHQPSHDANLELKDCDDSSYCVTHEGHHSHQCSGEDCTFVAARPRLARETESVSGSSADTNQSIVLAEQVLRATSLAGNRAAERISTFPLRAHLALQVLLL